MKTKEEHIFIIVMFNNSNFILITGSARGLGKELALVFAENSYNIILHDLVEADLDEMKREMSLKKVDFAAVSGDLKSEETLNNLYKISEEKQISILINNAGVHCPKLPLEELNDDQIDELLLTNLIAPIKLTRRLYPIFLKNGQGTIININSMTGLESQKFRTIYGASKWGLRGFSETLKVEAEEKNIRVLDVFPSRIKTRPAFTEGMETRYVAKKIYEIYKNTNNSKLILDDRAKRK